MDFKKQIDKRSDILLEMQENIKSIKESENELKKLTKCRSMMKIVVDDWNELTKDKKKLCLIRLLEILKKYRES